MNNRFELANSVVEEALDLPAGERDVFVPTACGADAVLIADVRRLLAISSAVDGFLDSPPDDSGEIRIGDLLGGRFRIVEPLGAGAMGSVFLAEDLQLGPVALKTLHPELREVPRVMERFQAEIGTARAVRHPNICAVFDLFTFELARGGPLVAFTMQYLQGETLARRLARGPIPPGEALRIAHGIGSAIDALHAEGIVHRDLKPDNIMLTLGRDGAITPVIMDFGLASRPGAEGPSVSGSPDYMAPEQFRTASAAKSADIYAFGLILFEMIAGARPFPAEDLLPAVIRRTTEDAPRVSGVAPGAPRAWDDAIARALLREPSMRPGSARELLDQIAAASRAPEAHTVRTGARCSHAAPRPARHQRMNAYPR